MTTEKRAAVVAGLIAGYRQLIARARERGVRVVGATILPCGGTKVYRSDAEADADRQAVNAWIRTSSAFDAVIDFDAVTRDPAHPERLLPAYDSGDQLHPSPAGYEAMGEAGADRAAAGRREVGRLGDVLGHQVVAQLAAVLGQVGDPGLGGRLAGVGDLA